MYRVDLIQQLLSVQSYWLYSLSLFGWKIEDKHISFCVLPL